MKSGRLYIQETYPLKQLSPLGAMVADLLDDLFCGLHHLSQKDLAKIDWHNTHHIIVILRGINFATYDNNLLTRLVFLAHWYCLRVEINGKKDALELMFHQRERKGSLSARHPTIDDAVAEFKRYVQSKENL